MKNLGVRVLSGTVLLALVLAAIWLRGPLLLALVATAAVLAAHEFYSIVRRAGYQPWYPAGLALTLLFALRSYIAGDLVAGVAYSGPGVAAEVMAVILVLVLALVRMGAAWARSGEPATRDGAELMDRSPYLVWADLGLTLAGAFYTGGLLGYAPVLASLSETSTHGDGVAWMLAVLLCTAACDTGAYFVGSLLGRHKMIPQISPGKTWEGLGGAVLGAVVAALALSGILRISWWGALLLGLLVCAAAVSGDLCESLLKRAAGVKDSGTIIPGHGGVLDRIDSILFVLLAVYWFTISSG
ncbi:MAG: phosphatidate cytidylyltransferase [Chloroflexota bacterium]